MGNGIDVPNTALTLAPGIVLYPRVIDRTAQIDLLRDLREVVGQAPLRRPVTPWGKPMRVRMSSAGAFGWITDRSGYRYEPKQPDGSPWPKIPSALLSLWEDYANCARVPECCLVNYYDHEAKMGLHQDRDEADFSCPVLSVSLGDTARFRYGGTDRKDPTRSVDLGSGDILVMSGPGRLAFHGIDRILAGSSTLIEAGGRINLTMRVVT